MHAHTHTHTGMLQFLICGKCTEVQCHHQNHFMHTVPWHKVLPSCGHSTCPPTHSGQQAQRTLAQLFCPFSEPPQHPPRPRLNNRCTSPWPKESPSVPGEGAVAKGERDERRDKRESPQHLVFPGGLATKY